MESTSQMPTSDDAPRRPMPPVVRRHGALHPVANPDDPAVQSPPRGQHGPLPGPYFAGLPGRGAIVEGQVFIVAFIMVVQLWLCTDALFELLSGRTHSLWWLMGASAVGFIIAFIVWRWPQRRIKQP
jgi:hypothetical protein